jgi:hypothetical protein
MTSPQDVGPLAEEAARFAEALSDWARGHIAMPSGSLGHGAECTLCPFCQLLSLLRQAKPETFGHLLDASASLTAALRSVVDTHSSHNAHGGIERIDLDDDADFE